MNLTEFDWKVEKWFSRVPALLQRSNELPHEKQELLEVARRIAEAERQR
jgi:hypothetical protein